MQLLYVQKLRRLKTILLSPSEFKKEVQIRRNARKTLSNYINGIPFAPFPLVVLLVVNEYCNQCCLVCDVGRRDPNSYYFKEHFKDKGNMSMKTFKAVVNSIRNAGSEIWFLATEPLLYPHLFWAIEHASSFGIETQLTTNGYLLPEKAERLVQAGIKRICLSIDGYSAEQHDYIRNCPGSYEKAIKGLQKIIDIKKKLRKNKPQIFINTVITPWNYSSLKRIVESLISFDIDGINLSHLQFLTPEMAEVHNKVHSEFPISARNISFSDRGKIDSAILDQQLKAIRKKFRHFRITMTPNLKNIEEVKAYYHSPERYIEDYRICYMPWRYPHILANGDVVINYECFSKPMGNINEQSLVSIWNGGRFQNFRAFIKKNQGSTTACWRCPMIYCGYKL
jgi:MoaA/NifB/PqqE/SkfB family radical SAM enzyme